LNNNLQHYDVIIVGAGAAGLMCALTAGQHQRQVLVLEKSNKIGKKILMSGGGRCNFTNLHVTPESYISNNPHFCKSALTQYTQWDFIALVEKYQINYHEKESEGGEPGQLFCNDSSKQILQLLKAECDDAKVSIQTKCDINSIQAQQLTYQSGDQFDRQFHLNTSSGNYSCESLVIATGGLSIPSLGGSDFGYQVARQFGLTLFKTEPSLVPMVLTDINKDLCSNLSGLSILAELSIHKHKFRGNLLFTHRGLSGPAILQLSNYWQPGENITINLAPDKNLEQVLIQLKNTKPKSHLSTLLSQIIPMNLVKQLEQLWWPSSQGLAITSYTHEQLQKIGYQLNHWKIKPAASEGYRTAEVTRGGIDCNELSSKTMETKKQKGLFFIGELLDVTGHLGGFNFQWAWSSGYVAGCSV